MWAFLFFFLFLGSAVFAIWFGIERLELLKSVEQQGTQLSELLSQLEGAKRDVQRLTIRLARLEKWSDIADAEEQIESMRMQAERKLIEAEKDADLMTLEVEQRLRQHRIATEKQILGDAIQLAEEIHKRGRPALQLNEIDLLSDEFSHNELGRRLKDVRQNARRAVKKGTAIISVFASDSAPDESGRFAIDTFNEKFELIISRLKKVPVEQLENEVRDAFGRLNLVCEKLHITRISSDYLKLKIEELRLASAVNHLRTLAREEQRRIREQMRDEQKARAEYERVLRETEKEEDMLRRAIEVAQQEVQASNARERAENERKLEELNRRLLEAENRNKRAMSMAQQTRRGYVYVISNIGSFGEDVFKIGLTRRWEPLDRIKELGDASVPFPFDVHAMILSEDAPALEHSLHKHFVTAQINKMNPRKEFFRLNLSTIRQEIEALGLSAIWTMAAEALEYRETLSIEASIQANPELRSEWIRHQLQLDDQEIIFENASENLESDSDNL